MLLCVSRPLSLSVQHESTIEDSYHRYLEVDDARVKLEILDTAGDEKYAHIRSHQLRAGHGFMIVFSIMDRSSFYSIRRYIHDIKNAHERHRHGDASTAPTRPHSPDEERRAHLSSLLVSQSLQRHSDPPSSSHYADLQEELQVGILLVGTRADLAYDGDRAVSSDEIDALARDLHLDYREVSCKKHSDVTAAFTALVRECRKVNVEDCSCGSAAARAAGKRYTPCTCRERCMTCNQTRLAHRMKSTTGGPSNKVQHEFVGTQIVQSNACCAIQ